MKSASLRCLKAFLVYQAVFNNVFEVSKLFMCLPPGHGWFTLIFHSAFEV